jgi:hypothetical protein
MEPPSPRRPTVGESSTNDQENPSEALTKWYVICHSCDYPLHHQETHTHTHTPSALLNSLFEQYALTFASVSLGTAYAVWKRPPNGLALMLVAGAGGSLLDLAYGWNVACVSHVEQWRRGHEAATAVVSAAEQEPSAASKP